MEAQKKSFPVGWILFGLVGIAGLSYLHYFHYETAKIVDGVLYLAFLIYVAQMK